MRCSSVSWQNVELETPFFWEVQEKYLVKKKNFHFAFVDFEKAFDKMPLDVVWWLRRKLDLEEWLFKLVQSVYRNQRIKVSFCVAPPLPLHIFLTPLYPSKQIPCPLPRHLKTKFLPVKTNSPFKKNLPLISVLIHSILPVIPRKWPFSLGACKISREKWNYRKIFYWVMTN